MKLLIRLTVAATTVVLATSALPSAAAGQAAAGPVGAQHSATTADDQVFEGFAPGGGLRSGDTLLASSFRRTCAVRPDGRVTCWGDEGTRERLSAAVLEDVVAVSIGDSIAGRFHTCALHGKGTVSCWGPGGKGQLGTGRTIDLYRPAKVPGLHDAVAIAAGADHTCAVRRNGRVACWGDGSFGQLGDGSTGSSRLPQLVPGLSGVATIAAGSHGNCAVHTDGGVSCWGWGVASTDGHLAPRRIGLPEDVVSVAAGWGRTCAVAASGRLYCWAFANAVQPAPVAGIRDAIAVSAGDRSFCVLHAGGDVSCWGENNAAGQLGVGTTDPQPEPVRLGGIADAVAVTVSTQSAVGQGHACAMRRDGSVSCWGANAFGQLGDGTFEPRLVPTSVREFRGFEPDDVPVNPTGFVRTWLDRYVEEREAEFPWLRTAWDHIRHRTHYVPHLGYGGLAGYVCHGRGVFQICTADRVVVRSMRLGTLVHELGHVFDFTPQLATSPRAWGAVQLYFAVKHPDCYTRHGFGAGVELLADTMQHLVIPTSWLGYHRPRADVAASAFDSLECPTIADQPTEEAKAVVLAGLAGRVPDWYTENITSGAELWAAIRRAPSVRVLQNLQDEFGGFCRVDWFTQPLDIDRLPPADENQFRDGGCV